MPRRSKRPQSVDNVGQKTYATKKNDYHGRNELAVNETSVNGYSGGMFFKFLVD